MNNLIMIKLDAEFEDNSLHRFDGFCIRLEANKGINIIPVWNNNTNKYFPLTLVAINGTSFSDGETVKTFENATADICAGENGLDIEIYPKSNFSNFETSKTYSISMVTVLNDLSFMNNLFLYFHRGIVDFNNKIISYSPLVSAIGKELNDQFRIRNIDKDSFFNTETFPNLKTIAFMPEPGQFKWSEFGVFVKLEKIKINTGHSTLTGDYRDMLDVMVMNGRKSGILNINIHEFNGNVLTNVNVSFSSSFSKGYEINEL